MSEEKKLRTFEVTLPIAGHARVTVEADDEAEAVEAALSIVTVDDIDEWEAVEQFTQGNVCYCPMPWEAEAVCVSDDEEADQ